jgi:hypothetical protein
MRQHCDRMIRNAYSSHVRIVGFSYNSRVHSLRLAGESDQEFASRAKRNCLIAKTLIVACLQNALIKQLLAESRLTEVNVRASPTVRVEYEQAVAIGGIGETLAVTKGKSWGDGPWIMPLEPDDEFCPDRITYLYRANSLYNRRFEQRKRLKELLGRHRSLVGKAQYNYHTKAIFLNGLTTIQANAIRRILHIEPGEFWRACRGKKFLDLPKRPVQTEFDFD